MTRTLWCIKSPHGVLVPGDVDLRRKDCIKYFTRRQNTGHTILRYGNDGQTWIELNRHHNWQQFYREGWRVVKVELREANKI